MFIHMLDAMTIAEDEEQSLKLAVMQPWVWSVSDFIFLALAYEGR